MKTGEKTGMGTAATLGNHLAALAHLFFPRHCPVCGQELGEGEEFLCIPCRWNMPLTQFWREADNPLLRKFDGIVPLERAASFFFYCKGSGYDRLIHGFKYEGRHALSYELGRWFGNELRESGLFGGIDVIVPVPLHYVRLVKRGYNQSELFARGIGTSLGTAISAGNVVRSVNNRSQARRGSNERWENVEGIFRVRHPQQLEGKHVLVVDDVVTTGATVESLMGAILGAAPDCRLSLAVLASSMKDIL
ncbi:MAG: ComF family protein [Rikenellaceae bacterium]|jgi:ComF family protein|nr:ComF family protein [Rikenellaceae bacterium]